jgi:two-component system OmpR family sensor kinase
MDGFQRHVGPSLRTRLSAWLGLAIVIGAIAAGTSAYNAAYGDALELQDDQLRQLAVLIARYDQPKSGFSFAGNAGGIDPETQFVVQTLPDSNDAFVQDGPLAGLKGGLPDGLQSVRPGKLGWRIAVTSLPSGARIAVGQRAAVRGELARSSARQVILPLLLLLPILMLVGHVIVRRTFRPIDAVAAGLDRRSDEDLRAMADDRLPTEIRPFVLAINRMLARLDQVMAIQRRFVADAAHELRSPLTALSLQAERLQESDMSEQARERLTTLRQGIRRSQNLVVQLLALARAQDQPVASEQRASVQKIFREVLEDLVPLAERKQIDIGVSGADEVVLSVSEMDLSILVKNLVDNAIRYTPNHGRVDLAVRIEGHNAVLQVSDTGPGIPQLERSRVFEPFYRTLGSDETGSGLGLSIVKAIADRIHAQVRLSESDAIGHTGLLVQVLVPVERSPRPAKK